MPTTTPTCPTDIGHQGWNPLALGRLDPLPESSSITTTVAPPPQRHRPFDQLYWRSWLSMLRKPGRVDCDINERRSAQLSGWAGQFVHCSLSFSCTWSSSDDTSGDTGEQRQQLACAARAGLHNPRAPPRRLRRQVQAQLGGRGYHEPRKGSPPHVVGSEYVGELRSKAISPRFHTRDLPRRAPADDDTSSDNTVTTVALPARPHRAHPSLPPHVAAIHRQRHGQPKLAFEPPEPVCFKHPLEQRMRHLGTHEQGRTGEDAAVVLSEYIWERVGSVGVTVCEPAMA